MRLKILIVALLAVLFLAGAASASTTQIFYPKITGVTINSTANGSLNGYATGPGTTSSWDGSSMFRTSLQTAATTETGKFSSARLGVISFGTSALPDNAYITSTTLYVSSRNNLTGLGSGWTVAVVNVVGNKLTNATNGSVDSGDYIKRGTVEESNRIAPANLYGLNISFALNDAGITNVSKTSDSVFMFVLSDILDNSFSGSWVANDWEGPSFYEYYDATGKKPHLDVTYILPPTAAFTPTTQQSGTAPYTASFTDTSTGDAPTSWKWEYSTDGSTWTQFSTDQNPSYEFPAGLYDVRLTATNAAGSTTSTLLNAVWSSATPACPINLATMYNVTGDGSDEFQKLNDAFVYAGNQSSCVINFPSSKTIISGTALVTGDNIEINGNSSTIRIKDGYSTVTGGFLTFGDYNYVHNLKFDGNWKGVNQSMTGVIDDISIGDWNIIENNEFYNLTEYGVWSYRTSNWILRNNTIHDCINYCVATGAGSTTVVSENITVYNNIIRNASGVGIKIRATGNSTISYNTVTIPDGASFSGVGIALYSNDASNNGVTIDHNNITGDFTNVTGAGTTTGILADPPANPNSIISNNDINSSYFGMNIQTNGVTIQNNVVNNSRYAGIRIISNNNQITQNLLKNSRLLVGTVGYYPSNNVFKSNILIRTGTPNDGAYLSYGGGESNVFDFNTVAVTNIGYNILLGTFRNTSVTNSTITASTCISNNGTATIEYNNTCNGAMDPVIVKFTAIQSIPSVGKKQVVFTDTSTGPTVLSRIWTATEIGNSTPVTIGTTSPLTVVFGAGNYSIVLNASAAIEANSTADNVYWVNVSGSSVPVNWWPDIHWWWWRLSQPLVSAG